MEGAIVVVVMLILIPVLEVLLAPEGPEYAVAVGLEDRHGKERRRPLLLLAEKKGRLAMVGILK